MVGGVGGDVPPRHRLIQRAPEQGVDLFHNRGGDGPPRLTLHRHRRFVQQRVIEQIKVVGSQVLHQHLPDKGVDVVLDAVAGIGQVGVTPDLQPVELYILLQQIRVGKIALSAPFRLDQLGRRAEGPNGFFVLYLSNPKIGCLQRGKPLGDLLGVAGAAVADLKLFAPFSRFDSSPPYIRCKSAGLSPQ